MQPCSLAGKVRHFSPARRGCMVSGPGPWQGSLQRTGMGSQHRQRPPDGLRRWGTLTRTCDCANWIESGMAETTEKTSEKRLSVAATKTLSLKGRGVEQGVVRQSFSHGRSKAVVVEKVKSRAPARTRADAAPPALAPTKRAAAGASAAPAQAPAVQVQPPAQVAPKPSGVVLRTLTDEERTARARALGDARQREAEERKHAEEEALHREEREEADRHERDAAEVRKVDEERRRKHELETKLKAEQEAKKRFGDESAAAAAGRPAAGARPALEPDEEEA